MAYVDQLQLCMQDYKSQIKYYASLTYLSQLSVTALGRRSCSCSDSNASALGY